MTQSLKVSKFAGFAAIAAVINSIIFLVAKATDATMIVNQGRTQEIVLPLVLASSLLGLVVAAYITSRIGIKSQGFLAKSPIIGLVFGIVTAAAPFSVSDDSKTTFALASMHVVAGVTWFIGAKRSIK